MIEANDPWKPDKDKLYSEFCTKIRATDDISFKLLGFVPLLSGSAIFLLLFKGNELKTLPLILLCVVGAVVTIGLFLWERRNIQTCKFFRDAAAKLEEVYFPNGVQPNKMLQTPTVFGKTQSERIIYAASIVVWVIPVISKLCCQ